MNKSDREIKDEVLKRAAALDRKAKRRKQTIPAVVIGIIIFLSPFSVALLPVSAPAESPDAFSTELYTESVTEQNTAKINAPAEKNSDAVFGYYNAPLGVITVNGEDYQYYPKVSGVDITEEDIGEFVGVVEDDSFLNGRKSYSYTKEENVIIVPFDNKYSAFIKIENGGDSQ